MRILFIGEIVGKSGVFTLKSTLPALKAKYKPDFIVADADSATGGAGLGVQHAVYLKKMGIDCLTVGDCAYYKIDMTEFYPKAPWVLRPANLPYDNPGRGWKIFSSAKGKVAIVMLLGQSGNSRTHAENPFNAIDYIIQKISSETKAIIVDFHSATTAEKLTLAAYVDGRVSAIIGSHCKALTADGRIMAGGTAAITDCGRTGSILSVGGMNPSSRVKEFMTAVRVWEGDGNLGLETQGFFVELGDTGRAEKVESFRMPCEESLDERSGSS